MKFRVKTSTLKQGLSIVNHATAQVTTTPILENILLKVNYNNLVLTSNNLETAIEYVIDENIHISSEGSFCVPSKIFTSYIGLIGEDEVNIELTGNGSIKIDTLASKLKIKGLEASDFPLIPSIKEDTSLSIQGSVLKQAIDKTLFSSAEGNIRPTLAGIMVNIDGKKAIFASTDSFRLSEYTTTFEGSNEAKFHQIIPSKTTNQIKNIIQDNDSVQIISGDNQIAFISGNTKIFSRLLNGKFPDYSSFFPATFSTKAEINKSDLMTALKKINLISRENNYSIKMSFSSESGILLETAETQIGEGDIQLTGSIDGEDNVIGINSTYFLEVLGVINTTHISIQFETPLSPILIQPVTDPEEKQPRGTFKHIIMPLKI